MPECYGWELWIRIKKSGSKRPQKKHSGIKDKSEKSKILDFYWSNAARMSAVCMEIRQ